MTDGTAEKELTARPSRRFYFSTRIFQLKALSNKKISSIWSYQRERWHSLRLQLLILHQKFFSLDNVSVVEEFIQLLVHPNMEITTYCSEDLNLTSAIIRGISDLYTIHERVLCYTITHWDHSNTCLQRRIHEEYKEYWNDPHMYL